MTCPSVAGSFTTRDFLLAARGFDLMIIAMSPIEAAGGALRNSSLSELACRLWAIEWRLSIESLRRRGVVHHRVASRRAARCDTGPVSPLSAAAGAGR